MDLVGLDTLVKDLIILSGSISAIIGLIWGRTKLNANNAATVAVRHDVALNTDVTTTIGRQQSETAIVVKAELGKQADKIKEEVGKAAAIVADKTVQATLEAQSAMFQSNADQNEMLGSIAKQGEMLAKQGEIIHTIVNGKMSIQLRINAELAKKIASLTNLQADIDAAVLAERNYKAYMATQAVVDASLITSDFKPH